ncbi:hypothetical protein JOY40_14925 [Bacillus tropicus]|uniref:hypothetical protein n=1 Tax=Bacillus TaxID=1386 RepID=UPI001F5897F3|nr:MULTISPECIES: hypothetical protein [Bacillus]HDR7774376.1 hypothetical protein [Bacillus tropicus]MDA1535463.1 hypothetical protein [Bacillus cereus group sp. TH254-2LC]MDA1546864.1 hypothetical protein [Bacillus cereus group sp. TH253LC]MDA1550620.1 hypothetical protein [Bacillus cereus group sp. TH243-3LC]MDA1629884.1 hypothetical protein [Bacillus cereus group sp. TH172LC]
MIYKKDANFPYPILSSNTFAYEESDFTIKVSFEEDGDLYRFKIKTNLISKFVEAVLEKGDAQYLLVIQSKDTKFFPVELHHPQVEIAKNRMSLLNRTSIQLHIVAKANINFEDNHELNSFYDGLKQSIVVQKNSMIGFSNIVTFEGGMKNPLDLFEKRLDPNLKSAIKYELGSECIIIHFRDKDIQFQSMSKANAFMNPYLYTGLRIALERFIKTYADEDDDVVELTQITQPEDLLDYKLYNLMTSKAVEELHIDNIDEVIGRISHQIIEKYVKAVKELVTHED